MKFWQIVNDLVSNIDSIFIFLQTYTMKKSFFMPILVVIFISMTLTLGGCGSQQNLENPEKVENQENKVKDSDVTMNECMV
jgi:ERCC4-type nuclease